MEETAGEKGGHCGGACEHTQSSFADANSLKRHTRVHTGEKPVACKWEGYGYRSSTINLKRHARVHTGEKLFACCLPQRFFRVTASLTGYHFLQTQDVHFFELRAIQRRVARLRCGWDSKVADATVGVTHYTPNIFELIWGANLAACCWT
jgi:hypothetical protein